ncbi:hypothetical protein [Streptomyces microflavus]|uniref:hypothetical protein n=1 Tax=Streptomyces microflavus TaxID=1919 RepID=UPI00369DD2BF
MQNRPSLPPPPPPVEIRSWPDREAMLADRAFVLGATGLALCVIGPASARPGDDTYGTVALTMGLGMVAWLTGLIGAVKALAHRRWVLRVLTAPAPDPLTPAGARSASSEPRPPGSGTPSPSSGR